MSDQPDDQHNLEHRIPGFRQAVNNLSNITSASGFHLATIVITQQPTRDGAPAPPTRITFAAPIAEPHQMTATTQPPERWISGPPPPPHQWRTGEPLPSLTPIQPIQYQQPPHPPPPLPTTTTTTTTTTATPATTQLPSPPVRSKRASTSALDTAQQQSPQKRKRLSEPSAPLPGLTSAAFWGTVLEERPGAPMGVIPSQIPQPQQPLPPHPSQRVIQPIPQELQQPFQQIQPAPQEAQQERLQRTSTFPVLRLRSPGRQRNHLLPSFPEQLAPTAPGLYPERHPSPDIPSSAQLHQQQPQRRFLRRAAGQILGRLSPFGGRPSLSRPSASRSPGAQEQIFRQPQLTTSGLPAIVPTPQRAAPEMLAQAPRERPFELHQLPPLQGLQGFQPHPPLIGQHSGSASGSGVSQARTAHNTTSPQAMAEGSRAPGSEATSRGRRGRRAGATPDREQFFECDQCNSKFKRKSDKNRHVRVVHEKSRPFVCPMCEKTFGEKSNMLKHRASVHDDVRTFRCPYCEQTFSQRGLCDTHVRTVHDKKQAKYFCEHCGLPFSRKVQLHEHYETVHPEYMASYGRLQTGQSTGAQAPATGSRTIRQETTRDRGGPETTRDRGGPASAGQPAGTGQQFPAREGTVHVGQAPMPVQRVEGSPSEPQQWAHYPPSSQPPVSNEIQQIHEPGSRPRSFQGESSGGDGA